MATSQNRTSPTSLNAMGQDAVDIFADAIKNFESSIPAADRQLFHGYRDSTTLLTAIRDQFSQPIYKGRLLSFCKKIEKFAARWEPFFEITTLLVNSHPEWASIAWGAVRLVFTLSSHYASFFGKLADMFEKLAEPLPSYARFIEQTRQIILSSNNAGQRRLLNILALIYSDILGVCQRAVTIFATKGPGIRHNLSVINDIFWKPFDTWFSDVLDRLSRHRSLFEFELILTGKEDASAHYAKVSQELENARQFRELQTARLQKEDARIEKNEARLLKQQVRDIKNWIHAPDYTALPEREAAEATEGTCQWFMSHPKYTAWKKLNNPPRPIAQDHDENPIFWVQGPPGYGKTVLSNFVIEDLRSASHQAGNGDGDIAYFHFDKLSQDCKEPQHALRAILNQIIHTRQNYGDVVDALTILMGVEGSGQRIASESDLATALSFTLRHSPNLRLLLDGVDECSDPTRFFRTLVSMFGNTTVKIIVFSRPEIAVPAVWKSAASVLRLGSRENSNCIQRFVRPRIDQMKQSELLPSGISTEDLISTISDRANSLFLWAKLMMVYLECPALSPRARLQTINERNLIEGLDQMYSRILDLISKKLRPQREAAFKTFQWLVAAHRPLHFLELQAALAIRIGQAINPDDYIMNFQQSIVTICGSLVDVQSDGTVQFIHLSVKEFLNQKPSHQETQTPGIFYIDVSTAQFFLTSSCLSYLQYDVPARPLSGYSKITPNKAQVQDQLPLLSYAVDWWINAIAGFLNLHNSLQIPFSLILYTFLPLLQRFLETQPSVTVWVESIWTFSETPRLQPLSGQMAAWSTRFSTLAGEEYSSSIKHLLQAGKDIAELSLDLRQLDDEWSRVLGANPTELWEPSINAFHSSRFLVRTDVSEITWSTASCVLTPHDGASANENHSAGGMILLSQVSKDGSFIGSIRLIPPSAFEKWQDQLADIYYDGDDDTDEENSRSSVPIEDFSRSEVVEQIALVESLSSGWTVIWKLEPVVPAELPVSTIIFELPPGQVFNMLMLLFHDMDPNQLQIPVSLSPDLRKLAILHSVVKANDRHDGHRLEQLDEDATEQSNQYIRDNPHRVQYNDPLIGNSRWQRTLFSPNGLFLAVIQSGDTCEENDHIEYADSSVIVYSNGQSEACFDKWVRMGKLGPFLQLGGVKTPLLFDPLETGLVVIANEKTYFWHFAESLQDNQDCHNHPLLQELHPRPLHSITFTDSGKYLFGVCDDYDTVRITISRSSGNMCSQPYSDVTPNEVRINDASYENEVLAADTVTSLSHAQGLLDISLSWAGDAVRSTILRQHENKSIVLSSLTTDGRERDAILLHIPKSLSEAGVSSTLLDAMNDSPTISLVVNKAVQHKYNIKQHPSVALPIVVERQKKTIDIFASNRYLRYSLNENQPRTKRRKI